MVERPRESIWSRGGWWVLAQFPLGGLALLAALVGPALPDAVRGPGRWLGVVLMVGGGSLFLVGAVRLGPGLTPFPKPLPGARLVETGVYGLARHPIYGGAIIGCAGWALLHGRWLGLLAALAFLVFFDAKARREERWLVEQFAEYPAYRRRVHKLIPFVY